MPLPDSSSVHEVTDLSPSGRSPAANLVLGAEARGFILGRPSRPTARLRFRRGAETREASGKTIRHVRTRVRRNSTSFTSTPTRYVAGARVLVHDDVLATGGTAARTATSPSSSVARRRARVRDRAGLPRGRQAARRPRRPLADPLLAHVRRPRRRLQLRHVRRAHDPLHVLVPGAGEARVALSWFRPQVEQLPRARAARGSLRSSSAAPAAAAPRLRLAPTSTGRTWARWRRDLCEFDDRNGGSVARSSPTSPHRGSRPASGRGASSATPRSVRVPGLPVRVRPPDGSGEEVGLAVRCPVCASVWIRTSSAHSTSTCRFTTARWASWSTSSPPTRVKEFAAELYSGRFDNRRLRSRPFTSGNQGYGLRGGGANVHGLTRGTRVACWGAGVAACWSGWQRRSATHEEQRLCYAPG